MGTHEIIGVVTTIVSAIVIIILAATSISRVNQIDRNNYSNIRQLYKRSPR